MLVPSVSRAVIAPLASSSVISVRGWRWASVMRGASQGSSDHVLHPLRYVSYRANVR